MFIKRTLAVVLTIIMTISALSVTALADAGYARKYISGGVLEEVDISIYAGKDGATLASVKEDLAKQGYSVDSKFDTISSTSLKKTTAAGGGVGTNLSNKAEITKGKSYNLSNGFTATLRCGAENLGECYFQFGNYYFVFKFEGDGTDRFRLYNGPSTLVKEEKVSGNSWGGTFNIKYENNILTVQRGTGTVYTLFEGALDGMSNAALAFGACGGGTSTLRYLKVETLGGFVNNSSFIMDRQFTSEDDSASIAADGWTIKRDNIAASGVAGSYGKKVSPDSSILFTGAAFGGDYEFNTGIYINFNTAKIPFNFVDDNTNYKIYIRGENGKGYMSLYKNGTILTNGTVNTADSNASTTMLASGEIQTGTAYTYAPINVGAKLETVDTGKKITIYTTSKTGGKISSVSYIDTDPIEEGYLGVDFETNTGPQTSINHFKVYPIGGENASFTANHLLNGAASSELDDGTVTLNTPVKLIGTQYKVISALYNDYTLKDVKLFDADQLFSGDVTLFETADSGNSIKTYFVNNLNDLSHIYPAMSLKYGAPMIWGVQSSINITEDDAATIITNRTTKQPGDLINGWSAIRSTCNNWKTVTGGGLKFGGWGDWSETTVSNNVIIPNLEKGFELDADLYVEYGMRMYIGKVKSFGDAENDYIEIRLQKDEDGRNDQWSVPIKIVRVKGDSSVSTTTSAKVSYSGFQTRTFKFVPNGLGGTFEIYKDGALADSVEIADALREGKIYLDCGAAVTGIKNVELRGYALAAEE